MFLTLNALFLSNIYIVVSFKAILSWMQKEDQYALRIQVLLVP